MVFRIAQVSDTHIAETPMYEGVNSRQRFLEVLTALRTQAPDLVVLSGDLAAQNGGVAIYRWMKEQLDALNLPYVVMPGNHDCVSEMRTVFEWPATIPAEGELFFNVEYEFANLCFLDSSSCCVSDRQLRWLQKQNATATKPIRLFVHHPPTHLGYYAADHRYSLENVAAFFQAVQKMAAIRTILCGHYHIGEEFEIGGKQILVCPSTMLQADLTREPAVKIPERYGFRWLELDEQGHLATQVAWLGTHFESVMSLDPMYSIKLPAVF